MLVAVICLGGAVSAAAQEETRWLTLSKPLIFTELDIEAERDTQSAGSSSYNSDRIYLAPTAGLNLKGDIYHANLLQFDIKGQGGYIEQDITANGTGGTQHSTQTSYLQNYDVNLLFLASKPYEAGFMAVKTHSFEQLDVFNQATVDAQSYGGHAGYASGPVPFTVAAKHVEENENGILYNNAYTQDDFSVNAENSRPRGETTFSYDYGQYSQQTSDISDKTTYQYGSLTDTEKFGKGSDLVSSGYFNQEDDESTFTNKSYNVILQENLLLKLSPAWDNFWNYSFDDASYQPDSSVTHSGQIGLRNQLYQSLSSEWDIHGTLQNNSGPGNNTSQDMYGIGNSETYIKRLGSWGRLTLGNTVRYDTTEENNTGMDTTILNEQHSLSDGTPVFLTQPLVISVNKVTDPTGSHIYIKGIDYNYFQVGSLTEIERIPTSLNLTNGSTVLVDYTVQSQPSGAYNTLNENFQVRLDLFNGLLGLYSQLGDLVNYTKQSFVLESGVSTLSGLDFTWRWLQAGGSYETESGNLVSYRALAAYESANFKTSPSSIISLNARERWAHYPVESLEVADYTLTTRFSDQFTTHLELSAEAGVWDEEGGPLAQTLFTAGMHAKYAIGKLLLTMSYQFNHQDTISGHNLRNFISFSARRDF